VDEIIVQQEAGVGQLRGGRSRKKPLYIIHLSKILQDIGDFLRHQQNKYTLERGKILIQIQVIVSFK
jgi:hypothetical protein